MAVYKSYCRKCDVFCWLGHGHLCQTLQADIEAEIEREKPGWAAKLGGESGDRWLVAISALGVPPPART